MISDIENAIFGCKLPFLIKNKDFELKMRILTENLYFGSKILIFEKIWDLDRNFRFEHTIFIEIFYWKYVFYRKLKFLGETMRIFINDICAEKTEQSKKNHLTTIYVT